MTPQPDPLHDAMDLGMGNQGQGLTATRYLDGSIVIWKNTPPYDQVAYLPAGATEPADLKDGRAAVAKPDGTVDVYPINNPPPQYAGTIATGAAPGQVPNTAPRSTNPISTAPGGYGSKGFMRSGEPVPLDPTQGSIDFGRGKPVTIRPEYARVLGNPTLAASLAPGYMPGSGTYNQARLDMPLNQWGDQYGGLFGPIGPKGVMSNTMYGLGGPGDPTNGSEIQTPDRWVTGDPNASMTAMQGDAAWRRSHPGGGGMAQMAYAAPYTPPPGNYPPPSPFPSPSEGARVMSGYGGGGGGGEGGGMFSSTVTSNWGQTAETAGKDYIATLFLRPDTGTGISTAAWSAPQQYWDGLAEEIRNGRILVNSPDGWAMLAQKGYTPQRIGGAALTGVSGRRAQGRTNATGNGEADALANANAYAAADRAATLAYQQALIRGADEDRALAAARDAWAQTYQTAGLTGMFNGNPTMAKIKQDFDEQMARAQQAIAEAGLTGTFQGQQTLAAIQQKFNQAVSEAGLTGLYNGQKTQAAIGQENQTALALMAQQAALSGPRNWSKYQSTFNSTPGGLQDVMSAFSGRYALPGATGANAQAQGGRASVAGLSGDILSGTYGQDGTQQPEATGNPYQADLRNWSRMQPSQREMVLGDFENKGWYGPDVENLINSAAPKYAGAQSGSYNLFK